MVDTALKTRSECSFTARKLRFLACFCLVSTASPTFFNGLLTPIRRRRVGQIRQKPSPEHTLDSIDTLIIGAGALGLACAARLAGPDTLIVEAERLIGSHASSRNSEVIHAGLYYPPGSLKAQLCLEGRARLHTWCAQHGVAVRNIGKLLVAVTPDECAALEALAANARACGVDDLQALERAQLQRLEPAVRGVAALLSPGTSILDSHGYLQSLLAAAERRGAQLVLRTRIDALVHDGDAWIAEGISADEPFRIRAQRVVNAGGLFAQRLATRTRGLAGIPALHLCQGRYFGYRGRSPFAHLIYPMPEAQTAGLGIHATLDLGGQLRFGPDVRYLNTPQALDSLDYRVDEQLGGPFAQAIRRYFPALEAERLTPGYSGIRPKLAGAGEPAADFLIQGPADHQLPGLVNLFGMESPGLTASLAVAERVAQAL